MSSRDVTIPGVIVPAFRVGPRSLPQVIIDRNEHSDSRSGKLMYKELDITQLLAAIKFSAERHRRQRRKGTDLPYINHPIDVAERLWRIGNVRDLSVMTAAILHDTVEDTFTTSAEIELRFGSKVRVLVDEVSDDKKLEKQERKRLQIDHAPSLSRGAKQIKLSDKISNVSDVTFNPPDWPVQRRREYLDWAEQVVTGLRGCNSELEQAFDTVMRVARRKLAEEEQRA